MIRRKSFVMIVPNDLIGLHTQRSKLRLLIGNWFRSAPIRNRPPIRAVPRSPSIYLTMVPSRGVEGKRAQIGVVANEMPKNETK